MALPIAPILMTLGRSVGVALRQWRGIVALTGMIVATGFTFNIMLSQAGKTALALWPLVALICFFLFAKEAFRGWAKIKRLEAEKGA